MKWYNGLFISGLLIYDECVTEFEMYRQSKSVWMIMYNSKQFANKNIAILKHWNYETIISLRTPPHKVMWNVFQIYQGYLVS